MQFPNWAAADIISGDIRPLLKDSEYNQLTRETLPIVHDCPQVAATFRAQDVPEDGFDAACNLLKETEGFFHAKMQTDPANPARDYECYNKVEIFTFSSYQNMHDYYRSVYGHDRGFSGIYFNVCDTWSPHPTILVYKTVDEIVLLEHEYIHHLDYRFLSAQGGRRSIVIEGLAMYLEHERHGRHSLGAGGGDILE